VGSSTDQTPETDPRGVNRDRQCNPCVGRERVGKTAGLQQRREDAVSQGSQLGTRLLEVVAQLVDHLDRFGRVVVNEDLRKTVAIAAIAAIATIASKCCRAPSCRLRSSFRRSASAPDDAPPRMRGMSAPEASSK
jgi:hypothetical protein